MDCSLRKPTVEELMGQAFKSGLAIDAAKLHTGICIFENGKAITYGFELNEIDMKDVHWEYKMRMDFREKLASYIEGKYFDVIIIEDCYGGENFDTVRKLLAIQTVIDELMFTNRVFCGEFLRKKEPEWMSDARNIFKEQPGMKAKAQAQSILDYLQFDFYLQYKDNPKNERDAKKLGVPSQASIFFEDRCDATVQLLSVAINKIMSSQVKASGNLSNLPWSAVKMEYLNVSEPALGSYDKVIKANTAKRIEVNYRNLKQSIVSAVNTFPDEVMYCILPTEKLGVFGIENRLPFYEDGEGWLFFYNKRSEKLKESVGGVA